MWAWNYILGERNTESKSCYTFVSQQSDIKSSELENYLRHRTIKVL